MNMKTLYLDLFSGISGDMMIGALLDLGVDFAQIQRELAKLKLEGYHLHLSRAKRFQIEGAKFDVHLSKPEPAHTHDFLPLQPHTHEHGGHSHSHFDLIPGLQHSHPHEHAHSHSGRNFSQIKQLITESLFSDWVKQKSIAVFQRVAEAEGKIHGQPPEQVHFHEVGAVDSIIDIIGTCLALEILGKPRVLASPVIEGVGWIDCAHGRFPVPAPATLAILAARGISVSQCEEPHELVTPTGAALLAEFAEQFGPMQNFTPSCIGFGIGTRDNKTRPNVLRAILGETAEVASHDWETDTIAVLQTNLDDINSEILGSFVDKAFTAGALDVFHTAIQMKKNRPGVLLTVLCNASDADKFSEMILRETTAFGVRRTMAERRKLRREIRPVATAFGNIAVKFGMLDSQTVQAAPEFETCKKLAAEKNVPIRQIYDAAVAALNTTK